MGLQGVAAVPTRLLAQTALILAGVSGTGGGRETGRVRTLTNPTIGVVQLCLNGESPEIQGIPGSNPVTELIKSRSTTRVQIYRSPVHCHIDTNQKNCPV